MAARATLAAIHVGVRAIDVFRRRLGAAGCGAGAGLSRGIGWSIRWRLVCSSGRSGRSPVRSTHLVGQALRIPTTRPVAGERPASNQYQQSCLHTKDDVLPSVVESYVAPGVIHITGQPAERSTDWNRAFRWAARLFAAAVALHAVDHLRRGMNALPPAVMIAGMLQLLLAAITVALVLLGSRWASPVPPSSSASPAQRASPLLTCCQRGASLATASSTHHPRHVSPGFPGLPRFAKSSPTFCSASSESQF